MNSARRIYQEVYSLPDFLLAPSHDDSRIKPKRWEWVVNQASLQIFASPASEVHDLGPLFKGGLLLGFHPTNLMLASCALGLDTALLCWGGLGRTGLRGLGEKLLLARSRTLLVNDPTTAQEIQQISGRSATLVPYCVDTDFFGFNGQGRQDGFLFCCSSNDRDPAPLLSMAEAGYQVIWNTSAEIAAGPWGSRHPNLKTTSNLSAVDLRWHYQNCAVFLMPTLGDKHAAGQTTILEALASGAPVVMTANRTARIFERLPTVFTIDSGAISDWLVAVEAALALCQTAPIATQSVCSHIESAHSIDACTAELVRVLESR